MRNRARWPVDACPDAGGRGYGHCDEIQLRADERRRRWEATDDSGKINKCNLLSRRDRIMSEYQTGRGIRIWVITGLGGSGGGDRRQLPFPIALTD